MPVSLATILAERAEVILPVGDDFLKVGFRPGIYTGAWDAQNVGRQFNDILPELICDWDFLDEQGEPYPITKETFEAHVPLPLKQRLYLAIMGAMFPNPPATPTTTAN